MRTGSKISVTEAIISFILCVVTGCGFIAMHINSSVPVNKEDAISVTGTYESYDYSQRRGTFHYITLFFSDIEEQTVDGSCYSETLFEEIENLEKGTALHMLVDGKSGLIIELATEGKLLLDSDVASDALKGERTEFAILGIGMIITGAGILIYVIRTKNNKIRK